MKEIKLTQGKVALVDDEDFEWLNQWKWQAQPSRKTFYACRSQVINGKKIQIRMHRVILGLTDKKVEGDHRDHDGLNNQKSNLREATLHENCFNKTKYKNKLSTFKGVGWYPKNKKWGVRIRLHGIQKFLGLFATQEEAAKVYDTNAKIYFGEFANLNFPIID